MTSYRVRLTWYGPNGATWEASCDGAFPEGTTAMHAIGIVAEWRHVDLSKCHRIEVEKLEP